MTGPALLVRPMTGEDLDAVIAIDRASFPVPWSPEHYRQEVFVNRLSHCWVAEIKGEVVGMLVGWLVVDEFQIGTIAVHQASRRRGIGHSLLQKALAQAKAGGAQTAVLEVRKSNRAAIALYERFGFRIMGERPRFYLDGEDAYTMTLTGLNHFNDYERSE